MLRKYKISRVQDGLDYETSNGDEKKYKMPRGLFSNRPDDYLRNVIEYSSHSNRDYN